MGVRSSLAPPDRVGALSFLTRDDRAAERVYRVRGMPKAEGQGSRQHHRRERNFSRGNSSTGRALDCRSRRRGFKSLLSRQFWNRYTNGSSSLTFNQVPLEGLRVRAPPGSPVCGNVVVMRDKGTTARRSRRTSPAKKGRRAGSEFLTPSVLMPRSSAGERTPDKGEVICSIQI